MKTARLVAFGVAVTGMAVAPAAAVAAAPHRLHTQTARQGSLRAEFSFRDTLITNYWDHGRIKIWSRGRLIVNRVTRLGPPGAYRNNKTVPERSVFVRQLDGTGPPEVIVNLWSGGMHCCSETWVFTGAHVTKEGWGHFNPPKLRDADGDGKPEFHGIDTGFAYLFGSFAASHFPAKVWSYANGRINDVTRSFPAEVQADMANQYAGYQECLTGENPNRSECVRGALAAYAADGYSLGQGDQAMAVVQAAIDAGQTDPGPEDESAAMPDYLEKLQEVLRQGGYA
jgi:hypothetical protein